MKKFDIGNMNTVAMVQTNAPKTVYGSGKRGAGYVDQYIDLKQVRGLFEATMGRRVLASGDVVPVQQFRFKMRLDPDVNNSLPNQLRFVIEGKLYTVDSVVYDRLSRIMYTEFKLNIFGK